VDDHLAIAALSNDELGAVVRLAVVRFGIGSAMTWSESLMFASLGDAHLAAWLGSFTNLCGYAGRP
jgi:hypothetical protein